MMVLVLASCSAKCAVRNDSSGNHRAPLKWTIDSQGRLPSTADACTPRPNLIKISGQRYA